MAEEGYVVDGGTYQLIDGGLYVAVNDTYQAVSEAYVVKNGVYERFYTSEALKGISESFTTSETTDLTLEKFISGSDSVSLSESIGKFEETRDRIKGVSESFTTSETTDIALVKAITGSDTVSLSESMGKFETSDGPSSLSTTWDSAGCGMDLDWTADTVNSQDIYRCSGSSCDPQQDGTLIDTVSAGTNHYDDGDGSGTTPTANSGDYTYQVVTSVGSTNTDSATAGECLQ